MARYVALALALAVGSVTAESSMSHPRLLAALAPAAAAARPAVTQKAPAKKAPALPVQWACQRNPIMGYDTPWTSYTCNLKSPLKRPVCVNFACGGVHVGACPIGGTGAGSNTITPGACSWGLFQAEQGATTCTPLNPIWPNSNAAFGFTVDGSKPIAVRPISVFYPKGTLCDGSDLQNQQGQQGGQQ